MEYIIILILSIFIINLYNKVNTLEVKFKKLYPETETPLLIKEKESEPLVKEKVVARVEKVSHEPDFLQNFISWLAKDWLVKLGGFIFLLGAIFFLSLAYSAVGEVGKMSIGFMLGAAVMLFGFWRSEQKSVSAGLTIFTIGSAISTYVAYSAYTDYKLFDVYTSIGVAVLISALTTFVALKFKNEIVACLSTLLIFSAPLLFSTGENNFVMLFSYLLAVTLASVWVAYYSRWVSVQLLSLASVSVYGFLYYLSLDTVVAPYNILALAFAIVFSGITVNIFDISRRKFVKVLDILFNILSLSYILFWVHTMVQTELRAPVLLLFCLGAIFLSGFIYRKSNSTEIFYLYGVGSVVYLFVSLSYLLEGKSLTIGFILLGGLVTYLTHIITRKYSTVALSYVSILPGLFMTFFYMDDYVWTMWRVGSRDFPGGEFWVIVLQGLSIFVTSIFYYLSYNKEKGKTFLVLLNYFSIAILSFLAYLVFGFDYRLLMVLAVSYSLITYLVSNFANIFPDLKKPVFLLNIIPLGFSVVLLYEYGVQENYFSILLVLMLQAILLLYEKFQDTNMKDFVKFFGAIVGVISCLWIWEVLHFYVNPDGLASLMAVFIYAVCGYAVLFRGYRIQDLQVVRAGQIVLGLVAARVLFVDAWAYGVEYGVLICMAVGAILIATTFVVKDIKLK